MNSATEDYLKVIFALHEWGEERVTTTAVAARLELAPSSASEMVRKLADLGLVAHEKYADITLTPDGQRAALAVLRRHRLIETYLVSLLGYSWDEVHDEAEVLEHAVSATMIERMDAALGHPWRDPHGDPIPTADGRLHQPVTRPLHRLGEGETGHVARISDDDPELLRYFTAHGLGLDDAVTVVERRPFGGALVVEVRRGTLRTQLDLGAQAAGALWVASSPPVPGGSSGCAYAECRHTP